MTGNVRGNRVKSLDFLRYPSSKPIFLFIGCYGRQIYPFFSFLSFFGVVALGKITNYLFDKPISHYICIYTFNIKNGPYKTTDRNSQRRA
jgi:hypothetical protein